MALTWTVNPATTGWHEIYTGARQVNDLAELRAVASAAGQRIVWLITSGEVEVGPQWYRTPETDATLKSWRPLALFVGADGGSPLLVAPFDVKSLELTGPAVQVAEGVLRGINPGNPFFDVSAAHTIGFSRSSFISCVSFILLMI